MNSLIRFFTLLLLSVSLTVHSAEFAIMNQNVTLTSTNNGFYFIYNTDKGPVNWVSPDNYRDGTVYFRYEMVDMPTTSASYFSFDIWGDWDPVARTYSESAAPISGALSHEGAVVTFSSSPKNWYNHAVNGSVNWYDRTTFWRWGICHWFSKNPNYLLAPKNWSNSPESWDAWTHKEDWLPVTVKVIIVAVSQGSVFSGWDNYTSGGGGGTKPPAPTYGIDYNSETTDKNVPSTDEYSTSSNMSGAVSGSGQKLSLTPGQDVYFRTKASGGNPASDIQHLNVPSRPSSPSVTIDFADEVTSAISSAVEYSLNSSMTSAVSGSNTGIAVTPGTDLYFRYKSTSSQFRSGIQSLDVPSRPSMPSITIDFINEKTSLVSSTMEYSNSSTMSSPVQGSNAGVTLTPGTDIYIRERATSSQFRSAVQFLDVPSRPSAPSITFNFLTEKTSSVSSAIEYSINQNLTSAVSGTNSQINVNPGTDLYFWYKAGDSQFRSAVQTLDVPVRPASPMFGINYQTEKTSAYVTSNYEYDDSPDMSTPVTGTGVYLNLTPGTSIYFRRKADLSNFCSAVQELVVPQRPAGPVVHIDYENVATSEIVSTGQLYSLNSNMSGSQRGIGNSVDLTPGSDMYFQSDYSDNSFKSSVYHLEVPSRPAIVSSVGNIMNGTFFIASLEFNADTAGLGKDGLQSSNAEIHQDGLNILVEPLAVGEIKIKIKANAIQAGNFASEELVTTYNPATKVSEFTDEYILIYPNPATRALYLEVDKSYLPAKLSILNLQGAVVYFKELHENLNKIDISGLNKGVYLVKVGNLKGELYAKKIVFK